MEVIIMRLNTNVENLTTQVNSQSNGRALNQSLERLSSGLRINKAADDASGMAIADSLRNQSNSLGQAIKNSNDAVGIVQIADKAMDEQLKILDTIKTKATQAAQDGQTSDTRKAIQADITKLLEALDNIATTTSFNGQSLLNGTYTNKKFQVGAYSQQTVKMSVMSTHSTKVGDVRFETGQRMSADADVTLTFKDVDGVNDVTLETVSISYGVGTGVGALADVINKNSNALKGVKASWTVETTGATAISGGDVTGLKINSVTIGDVSAIASMDNDGRLVNAINEVTDQTGVEAYTDERGRLNLRSLDGRGISISGAGLTTAAGLATNQDANYGRLTLSRMGGKDIKISGTNFTAVGFNEAVESERTINLGYMKGTIDKSVLSAIGGNANSNVPTRENGNDIGAGVTTLAGAMALMDVADAAIRQLDKVRSDIGSVQNQLTATINNISVTQVNVKAAESQIRDVDFAEESANFQKHNLLAQSGSYAMSQSLQTQQNIMRLLQ
jgi:flagellin